MEQEKRYLILGCRGGKTHKHNAWFLIMDKSDLTSYYENQLPARNSKGFFFLMNNFSKTLSNLSLNKMRFHISRELKYIYLKKKKKLKQKGIWCFTDIPTPSGNLNSHQRVWQSFESPSVLEHMCTQCTLNRSNGKKQKTKKKTSLKLYHSS